MSTRGILLLTLLALACALAFAPQALATCSSPANAIEAENCLPGSTGWDVGHAVRFLLSSHARFITGHTLVVDGGATLISRPRATDTQ